MTDPISDMLARIRNAQAVEKAEVVIPFSQFKYQIAKILEKEGFIGGIKRSGRGAKKNMVVILKYQEGEPCIAGLKRVSKPGQRIYQSLKEIRPVRGGFGISLISTPQGLMTNKKARKKKVGGEVVCEVW